MPSAKYSIKYNDKANRGDLNEETLINLIQEDTLILPDKSGIDSVTIQKTFGRPEDYIELHIYNTSDQLITSNLNFQNFEFPSDVE